MDASQTCQACGAVHFQTAKVAAGALVIRSDRILLGRRAVDPGRGKWDIPGGFLRPWEEPADAARREAREETGLTITPGGVLTMVLDRYVAWYVINVFYLAAVSGGAEQPGDDLSELAWFGKDDIPSGPSVAFDNCRIALDLWRTGAQQSRA